MCLRPNKIDRVVVYSSPNGTRETPLNSQIGMSARARDTCAKRVVVNKESIISRGIVLGARMAMKERSSSTDQNR